MTLVLTRTIANKKPRFKSQAAIVDGAANVLLFVLFDNGSNGTMIELHKMTPAGDWTYINTRTAEVGKMDTLCAVQSGANAYTFPSDHDGDPKTDVTYQVWQGVCVPYGAQGPQLAKPGAFVPPGEPTVDIDYARIQAMIETAIHSILGVPPGHTLIGDIRPQIRANVEELYQDGDHGGSSVVFQQLLNTSFAGCVSALHQSGQINQSTHDALMATIKPVRKAKKAKP